ncbi:hypothetical protein SKAU_G00088030 [Synaphobranchus kaupii]|uniref:Uncharacterized protein n=1 Tax=Synaphobranchus kaupii TaxID=118154 RepID=A0A9Q1J412_SYNKA|nr:hypothetical protein SKAU_G00088030 [Synaphobranchus kaupii]
MEVFLLRLGSKWSTLNHTCRGRSSRRPSGVTPRGHCKHAHQPKECSDFYQRVRLKALNEEQVKPLFSRFTVRPSAVTWATVSAVLLAALSPLGCVLRPGSLFGGAVPEGSLDVLNYSRSPLKGQESCTFTRPLLRNEAARPPASRLLLFSPLILSLRRALRRGITSCLEVGRDAGGCLVTTSDVGNPGLVERFTG